MAAAASAGATPAPRPGPRAPPAAPPMPVLSPLVVDVTRDSDEERAEVVDVIDESEDEEEQTRDEEKLQVPSSVPPLRFRGYRRGRELGRGASGKVFVCTKKGCETSFAVKVVDLRRLQLSSNAERQRAALRREVDILKSLPPHPAIVQMVDAFEESNWFLLILELVGGGDLYTALTSREPARLLEREAAFVQRQLVDGLSFLHGQGVIHRDLKLENILIDSECREAPPLVLYSIKITDFGLSKVIGAGISEARSLVGTRTYTAPEVLKGSVYDFSADLWCLGVLMYVLLVGQFPFDGTPANQHEADAGLQGCETSPRGKSSLSGLAKSMLFGLLRFDPGSRYSLEAIASHEWLQEGGEREASASERPVKRQCTESPKAHVRQVGPKASQESHRSADSHDKLALPPSSPDASGPHPSCMEFEVPGAPAVEELRSAGEAPPKGAAGQPCQTKQPQLDFKLSEESGSPQQPEDSPEHPQSPECLATRSAASLRAGLELTDVFPVSAQPEEMQTHMLVPARLAEQLLGRRGAEARKLAATVGCQLQVHAPADDKEADHRVIVVGACNQCAFVQELLFSRLCEALRADGQGPATDRAALLLLVRAEAAGVVIGKQGFVLRQIGRQSGATIEIMRDEVKRQRPCLVAGPLQSVLRAEKHVFDLVSAVPLAGPASRPWKKNEVARRTPKQLPRSRVSQELVGGVVVSWKGQFGWIQADEPIGHHQASAHQGLIYLNGKDVVGGAALVAGQRVRFQVYSDSSGLGAEECVTA